MNQPDLPRLLAGVRDILESDGRIFAESRSADFREGYAAALATFVTYSRAYVSLMLSSGRLEDDGEHVRVVLRPRD